MKIAKNTSSIRAAKTSSEYQHFCSRLSSFEMLIYAEAEKKLKCSPDRQNLRRHFRTDFSSPSPLYVVSCLLISRLIKQNRQQQVERIKDVDKLYTDITFPIPLRATCSTISISPKSDTIKHSMNISMSINNLIRLYQEFQLANCSEICAPASGRVEARRQIAVRTGPT